MKEVPISNCERSFLLDSLRSLHRLDGRNLCERRHLNISFGDEWGACMVTLGETRVSSHVSCFVTEPRVSRPNEGILRINVELSPMSAPRFSGGTSTGRLTEEAVEINRILERCLRESRCIDMESLCIMAEEKVWCIQLDVHVLNDEGNMIDCASIASLASLCHFRRPDVSLDSNELKIFTTAEREPIVLGINHYPICSTFAFFKRGENLEVQENKSVDIVTDPSRLEEAVMDGKLVVGVNPFREVCTLHLAGQLLVDKEVVLQLAATAASYAKFVADKIKAEVAKCRLPSSTAFVIPCSEGSVNDTNRRFIIPTSTPVSVDYVNRIVSSQNEVSMIEDSEDNIKVVEICDGLVEMSSTQTVEEDVSHENDSDCDMEIIKTISVEEKRMERTLAEIDLIDEDQEEDFSIILTGSDLTSANDTRAWYKKSNNWC